MSTDSKPAAEGWGFPAGSRKAHYFAETESLCGRWGFYRGPLEPETGEPSSEDCSPCRRALLRRPAPTTEVPNVPR